MPSFKDNLNREWTIEITGMEVKQLRKELSLDILAAFEEGDQNLLLRLARDPVLLVDCISVLLTEQIKRIGLDERQFASGLVGDGLQAAIDCLVEAIALFSRPHQRGMVRKIWTESQRIENNAAEKIQNAIPQVGRRLEEEFDRRLEKLKNEFSSSPAE